MNNLNWNKLKVFYRVASCGSYARAAEKYNVTATALSKMVKSLEYEVSCQLLTRTDTGVELTPKGELLYRDAIRIANMLEFTEEKISQDYNGIKKYLKLVAPTGLSTMYIAHFIDDFISRHPEIRLEIVSYDDMSLNEKLTGHLLIHPFLQDVNGYKQFPLTAMELGLFASKEYLSRFGVPLTVDDLNNHRLIAFSRNKKLPVDLNWHLKIGMPDGNERIPVFEADANFGRCYLAHKGVGIISVPKQHPDVKKYELVRVLPHLEGERYAYHLIVDEALYENKIIAEFSDFIKDSFANL